MSKEEIRRELGIYNGHTFEDSPPATKKAKYQPGRRSTVVLYVSSTHVLQTWYLVVYSPVTRRGSDTFFMVKNHFVLRLSPQKEILVTFVRNPQPHPLSRRNGLVNQVEFLG